MKKIVLLMVFLIMACSVTSVAAYDATYEDMKIKME